jgi:hypothetical protein
MTSPVGATTPRGARPGLDQRAADRFPVNAGTACEFAGPIAEDSGPTKVLNVSMAGVGLRLVKRVEPETLMAVTLANKAKGFAKTVIVRVAHVAPDAGGWVVGALFLTPLTYQEMTALVL